MHVEIGYKEFAERLKGYFSESALEALYAFLEAEDDGEFSAEEVKDEWSEYESLESYNEHMDTKWESYSEIPYKYLMFFSGVVVSNKRVLPNKDEGILPFDKFMFDVWAGFPAWKRFKSDEARAVTSLISDVVGKTDDDMMAHVIYILGVPDGNVFGKMYKNGQHYTVMSKGMLDITKYFCKAEPDKMILAEAQKLVDKFMPAYNGASNLG